MTDSENPILPIDTDVQARNDAFEDMAIEEKFDVTWAFFGAALLHNTDTGKHKVRNIIIRNPVSYAEAVGTAFLALKSKYKGTKWELIHLAMENEPVWADVKPLEDQSA